MLAKFFRNCYLLSLLLLLTACTSEPPDFPEMSSINWMRFASPELGVELRIPDTWSIEEYEDGSSVIFKQEGYPVMMISLLDEKEAHDQGLWAISEPLGEDIFIGKPSRQYRYDHQDTLYIFPTLSWVIPWRSRFLEVAFRTRNPQVDNTQQAILGSLNLLDTES